MEDYSRARDYLVRLITHNPYNLDTWFDLAFTLRHLGAYEEAEVIIFEYDHVMYYFNRLRLSGKRYEQLQELLREIRKKTAVRRLCRLTGRKKRYAKAKPTGQ